MNKATSYPTFVRNFSTTKLNQYACHAKYHLWPQSSWDLESWYAPNGDWFATRCNWG